MFSNARRHPKLDLCIIPVPGDGNCQFSSVARGLRIGGVNRLPNGEYVSMQTLRKFVAESITPTSVSLLLETYANNANWLNVIDTRASIEMIVKQVGVVIASHSPVYYQGDDWSLGVMSQALQIFFILLRSDGTIQGGMPDATANAKIIILYFTDMDRGARPNGNTMGHYELVCHGDRTLFTLRTLPLSILQLIKAQQPSQYAIIEKMNAVRIVDEKPQITDTIACSPSSEDESIFPLFYNSTPTTPEHMHVVFEHSILSLEDRMTHLRLNEFAQEYNLSLTTIDATVKITAKKAITGIYTIRVDASLMDPMEDQVNITFQSTELIEVVDWLQRHIRDPIIRMTVKTSFHKDFVPVENIDVNFI